MNFDVISLGKATEQKLKAVNWVRRCYLVYVLVIVLFLFTSQGIAARKGGEKYLIIHLDAVSSADFFEVLSRGELPNIAEVFAGGQEVKAGITLFPGGTETIVPRLNQGLDNSEGDIVGWGYFRAETEKKVTSISVFPRLVMELDRRSRHQFLLGLPGFVPLAGLSLLNLDRLWETQDVVQFYWFNTDVMGHLQGREAHLTSIKDFDESLGLALRAGKLDGINILLYTDHGMSTIGVKPIHYRRELRKLLGKEYKFAFYPHLYLSDQTKKEEIAQLVVDNTAIDLAFVKISSDTVLGYHAEGSFEIVKKRDKFAYRYCGEDFFDYGATGLSDAFLSKEEWLKETKNLLYPAALPNIFTFLEHPNVGDIVFVLNPPYTPFSIQSQRGHHSGLLHTDIMVPLLYDGPAFADVEPFEEFWLHELFSKHFPMIDLDAPKRRENHELTIGLPGTLEMALSPAHRWRLGIKFSEQLLTPWIEYDLYSSFFTRVWVGGVIENFQPHWRLRVEGFLGPLGINWLKQSGAPGSLSLKLRLHDQVELIVAKNKAAVSFNF